MYYFILTNTTLKKFVLQAGSMQVERRCQFRILEECIHKLLNDK